VKLEPESIPHLNCFPYCEHLKKRDDITRLFKTAKTVSCQGARLLYLKNDFSYNRIAFTFARKFGNAVQRNRARRLSREAYRHLRQNLRCGFDMAVLVYPQEIDYKGRLKQLEILFSKSALFAQ
jgi:ribonuclease P protein component